MLQAFFGFTFLVILRHYWVLPFFVTTIPRNQSLTQCQWHSASFIFNNSYFHLILRGHKIAAIITAEYIEAGFHQKSALSKDFDL